MPIYVWIVHSNVQSDALWDFIILYQMPITFLILIVVVVVPVSTFTSGLAISCSTQQDKQLDTQWNGGLNLPYYCSSHYRSTEILAQYLAFFNVLALAMSECRTPIYRHSSRLRETQWVLLYIFMRNNLLKN